MFESVFSSTPIRNAILQSAFSLWLQLGNSSPRDMSGAPKSTRKIISEVLSCTNPKALISALSNLDNTMAQEIIAYCRMGEFISGRDLKSLNEPVEVLCRLSSDGNHRARKVLSGVSTLISGGSPTAAGIDDEEAALYAAEFFLESDMPELSSRITMAFENREISLRSRLVAWSILDSRGVKKEAVKVLEEGKELGCDECAGLLEAELLLSGKKQNVNWKWLQRSAESGYGKALYAASIALEYGHGIDADSVLSRHYSSIASFFPQFKLITTYYPTPSPPPPPNAKTLLLASNWASRHPSRPIHLYASQIWANLYLSA